MGTRPLILLIYISAIAVCLGLAACAVINQDRFGELPKGERLERIQESPNYRDGKFRNLVQTPKFSTDDGMMSVIWSGIFNKAERLTPDRPIPTAKTDLRKLSARSPQKDTVVWTGHSSWYIRAGGKQILIDPVFSKSAAPFSFLNKAFAGTNIYTAKDLPRIDCLLISHDHWDHLDYPTIMALKSKVKQVICPLGVGAYFENWGYPKENIREGDWHDKISLGEDVVVHVLPARHYSGRLFKENKTLWAGFAVETPEHRIFFSGDSGYGSHFSEIGKAFNGFDLVMLDCGQYDPRWAYIHMTPKEAVQAARDLGAKAFIPAHVGRFTIANHPWDEPFKQLAEDRDDYPFRLLTPKIGELVVLDAESSQQFSCWWETTGDCPETEQSGEKKANKDQGTMRMNVTANGKTTVFELNTSAAAKDLYAQLPLNIKVEPYSNNEKIFYPPKKLDITAAPKANAKAGTLAYYAPWADVVMFYGNFGSAPGLYELGYAVSGQEYIQEMSGTIQIEK